MLSKLALPGLQLSPRARFLVLVGVLYLLWLVVYEGIIGGNESRLDWLLSANIAAASAGLLRALGFATSATGGALFMDGLPAVLVGPPCNGLVVYTIFAGFIVAFPSPWQPKLWFIPAGLVLLYGINIMRVAALALNHHYAHRSVDFNHHYTFTALVYACIGALWMLWVRRYGAAVTE